MLLFGNIRSALVLLYFLFHNCESALKKIYWETNDYRISKPGMRPTFYRLVFKPSFEKRTFELQSFVSINITQWTALYKFYVKNLLFHNSCECEPFNLTEDNIVDGAYFQPRKPRSAAEPGDIIHLMTDTLFDPKYETQYALHCRNIEGLLTNQLRGFYYDEYYENGKIQNFLTTQFGPWGSRYAFPSFDEPCYRSKFKIIIYRPIEYSCVLSNSRLVSSIISGQLIEEEFDMTENIAPSSLVFIVSKLKVSDKISGNIHQYVVREDVLISKQYEYANEIIFAAYKEIQNFLNVNCLLRRLYHVGLPSNRMQFDNLGSYRGMNQYKERVLLISKDMSAVEQERSAIAIVKLLAQQWFINYIIPESWTWAWLSEGFTMYLSYNITSKMYPRSLMDERLICKIRNSMQIDSGIYSLALNDEAMKPSEIESKFNKVTVYKGAALIITMERILSPDVFKGSITDLFQESKFSTYTSKSYYEIIESRIKAFHRVDLRLPMSFSAIMLTWEGQVGYPVLTVTRNYNSDQETVSVSQTRFWFHKSNSVWAIPISYSSPLCLYFNDTRPMDWLVTQSGHIKIKNLRSHDWLILNNQATFYYRVNYDERNWNLIIDTLTSDHESIHYLNRMQLISDAFNLAEYGILSYKIAFKVSSYIVREKEYAPLWAMKEAYYSLNHKLIDSNEYASFKTTIKHSVEFIYNQLYCDGCPKPDDVDTHRYNLILKLLFSWLCDLNSEKCCCIQKISRTNKKNPPPVPLEVQNDVEMQVLCNSIRLGTKEHWNRLFDAYKSLNTNNENNRSTFNALLCTENGELQHRFLNYIKESDKYKLLEALKLAISKEYKGLIAALQFTLKHINYLFKEFIHRDVTDLLIDIGSRVTTQKELDTLTKFSTRHVQYSKLIKLPIRRARHNLVWRKNHLKEIDTYSKAIDTYSKEIKTSAAISYKNVHIVTLVLPYFAKLYLLY